MSLFFKSKSLLSKEDNETVVAAIREIEQKTTGEIRVFIESKCKFVDSIDRAIQLFDKLKMRETKKRNAVLIYLAITHKQFAFYGDEAIFNQAGGEMFWKSAANHFQNNLHEKSLAESLVVAIQELGAALTTHFPFDPEVTKNELPDEIVFGQ